MGEHVVVVLTAVAVVVVVLVAAITVVVTAETVLAVVVGQMVDITTVLTSGHDDEIGVTIKETTHIN